MNAAFHTVVRWYLSEKGAVDKDTSDIVRLIDKGLQENDTPAATVLVAILTESGDMAVVKEDELILELIGVGKELAIAEHMLERAEKLSEIRTIVDLPAGSAIAERVRAFAIRKHIETLQ